MSQNDDMISRQAAIDAVRELYIQSPKISNDIAYDTAIDQAHDALANLPSAQLKRKNGKWVNCYTDGFGNMCKCSECGARIDIQEKFRSFFCYHCGADMREDVLPPTQPEFDKEKISDLLRSLYLFGLVHFTKEGIVRKQHYCEELWEALFHDDEFPVWMHWYDIEREKS